MEEIAKRSQELRSARRQLMVENKISLRELYRIIEETPDNPASEAQGKLDNAVRSAYGMKKNEDILSFLLSLNLSLADAEARGEKVVGPGLPAWVNKKDDFISSDCVSISQ